LSAAGLCVLVVPGHRRAHRPAPVSPGRCDAGGDHMSDRAAAASATAGGQRELIHRRRPCGPSPLL